jgi:CSLREA domain-containing protein
MKRAVLIVVIAALAAAAVSGAARAADIVITVTSVADGGAGACPSDNACTLRKAIETANADASGEPVVITFDAAAFPIDSPKTIVVGTSALPTLTRATVAIDAANAGVRLVSDGQNLSGSVNGLVLTGAHAAVRGLAISGFSGSCLVLSGEGSWAGGDATAREGNRFGSCGVAIALLGPSGSATGNVIGVDESGQAAPVGTGILIAGQGATVGGESVDGHLANRIGNATAAIQVGEPGGAAASGAAITRNIIGRDPQSNPAPVTFGVLIQPPSGGVIVRLNTIAYASTAIAVAGTTNGPPSMGNRFEQDSFQALTGLAIDLGADGIANANDGDDIDSGANGLLNHPVFVRAVQARITGTVGGCAGCAVQLYLADHRPGSPNDYGTIPVPGGAVSASADGSFAFDSPAVTPGQWITALVTDATGNTSEFAPAARVGSGVAQCGNIALQPGWNHSGYFGAEPLLLGTSFPSAGPGAGAVTAIYHLRDGSTAFDAWFANGTAGRTLNTLEPGEAYWFYTTSAVTLAAGFSLSVPLPVALEPGWNDIVYIGASADLRDAFAGAATGAQGIYRWSVGDANWQTFGDLATPAWARDFSDVQQCGAYELYMSSAATLTPLQP